MALHYFIIMNMSDYFCVTFLQKVRSNTMHSSEIHRITFDTTCLVQLSAFEEPLCCITFCPISDIYYLPLPSNNLHIP